MVAGRVGEEIPSIVNGAVAEFAFGGIVVDVVDGAAGFLLVPFRRTAETAGEQATGCPVQGAVVLLDKFRCVLLDESG